MDEPKKPARPLKTVAKQALATAPLPQASAPKVAAPKAALAPAKTAIRPVAAAIKAAGDVADAVSQAVKSVPVPTAKKPVVVAAGLAATPKPMDLPSPTSSTEGTQIMATTAETFANETAARTQGAFAELQSRSKGAMEKGAKFYEEMGDFAKGNVEAIVASSRVAASAMESLGQDAAAYGKKSFEHAQSTLKSAAAVKSPTELFQLQSDYARAAFDAFVAESSRFSERMVKLAGEVAQPISSRFAVAAEKVKSTAL